MCSYKIYTYKFHLYAHVCRMYFPAHFDLQLVDATFTSIVLAEALILRKLCTVQP
jgi:hypothetical protein